ncbi:hypothetical protein PGT21_017392 [Puccinia graminis f. sp. tritici]|uniref:RING-type domain-containing protein n=1 Tax=Puccinia graminis f. sp. tritici TaxID=56615 RepID=A0A5B0NWD1_PUCGR|nr:hypothetical protein PGT21_017392 [Puccinia graminis f. sp. tritici]KAA1093455.1 hypothetical protein PGTUg99_017724 [Puccinia graminis f. sp. tritici]
MSKLLFLSSLVFYALIPMALQIPFNGPNRYALPQGRLSLHHDLDPQAFHNGIPNNPNRGRINNSAHLGTRLLERIRRRFSNCIPGRQRISGRSQQQRAPSTAPRVDNWLDEYSRRPIVEARIHYFPRLRLFKDTDRITNTMLLGYMPRHEYLSPPKERHTTPLSQIPNTLGAATVDQPGGSGIDTSQSRLEGIPAELRGTSNTLNLQAQQTNGCSPKDQDSLFRPKRHHIVPLNQVIKILAVSETNQQGVSSLGTVSNWSQGPLAGVGRIGDSLNVNGKQIGDAGHEDTNQISDVLLGEPDDRTCIACLEEFQGPRQDANNQLIIDSFDRVLLIKGCGHYFHRQCLQKWILGSKRNTCPLCRKKIFQ